MNFIDRLEKRFDRFSITNLTYILIGGQALSFMLIQFYPAYAGIFSLQGNLILQGQWWRVLTFLFYPISRDLFFAVFVWYIFYLYGTVLEKRWGFFRYLMYILISYIATIVLAFIFPYTPLSNGYIYASLFLAFAHLYPDFQLLIFFILPVKVKWLAMLVWIGIIGSLLLGPFSTKILTIGSISNFLIFFGSDIWIVTLRRLRHLPVGSKYIVKEKAYHTCVVCGDNEVDNPKMQIRYCNKCVPSLCYCGDHIKSHSHVVKPN